MFERNKDKTLMQERRDHYAQMEDFKVTRDGEGKIIPVEVDTDFGPVLAVPMTYGDIEAMTRGSKKGGGLSAEIVAKQISRHILKPVEMASVTAEMIREQFKAMAVKALLDAVMEASGMKDQIEIEVDEDGTTRVKEVDPNA